MKKRLTCTEKLEQEALKIKTETGGDQARFMERVSGRDIIFVGYMFGKAFDLDEPYIRIKELGYDW